MDCRLDALDPSDPTGVQTWTVVLSDAKLQWLRTEAPEHKLCRLQLARDVLKNPTVIFHGWERPDHEDSNRYGYQAWPPT